MLCNDNRIKHHHIPRFYRVGNSKFCPKILELKEFHEKGSKDFFRYRLTSDVVYII